MSLIIPVPPEMEEPDVLVSLRQLNYPSDRLELLLAEGRLPPRQRNKAAAETHGEYLLFLDDDMRLDPEYLQRMVRLYRIGGCDALGGPSLPLAGKSAVEKAIAFTLGSWWGLGPLSSRYRKNPPRENATDRQLILCNQSIRRDLFIGSGGFDERLFPNEENELIDRMRRAGVRFGYHPDLAASRPVEPSLAAHWKKIFRYGQGRASQIKINPSLRSCEHLLLILVGTTAMAAAFGGWPIARWILCIYGLWLLGAALHAAFKNCSPLTGLLSALAIAGTHVSYWAGFWYGLFKENATRHTLDGAEVRLRRIHL